ncbi:MAG: hypothetical protein LQ338_005382 [Usnochroma carphineum]|nr:MAG: hypothetical protein LQ338_005382 [Usnochroma carphineum]
MQDPSRRDQLPSLSMTSPINNTNTTEDTFSLLSDNVQRLRKPSRSNAQVRRRRVEATQRAKREVLANVREDWEWPPTTGYNEGRFPRGRNSTQWRERESDSSPSASRSPSPSSQDPYRFESPDAVAPSFVPNRTKRRKLMQEEMEWNEGLKVFTERRDFWTGAKAPVAPSSHYQKHPERTIADTEPGVVVAATAASDQRDFACERLPNTTSLSLGDSDDSSTFSKQSRDASTSAPSSSPPSTRTSQSSDILPSHTTIHNNTSSSAAAAKQNPPPTLVPLAPPLLSPTEHPDLAKIIPAFYSTIYSRCVVQSLAPSFPISLKDVVGSLVQGWKEDGEWPPKASLQEAAPRKDSLREKMKGLRMDGEDVRLEKVARKGVGKVKRALGR